MKRGMAYCGLTRGNELSKRVADQRLRKDYPPERFQAASAGDGRTGAALRFEGLIQVFY